MDNKHNGGLYRGDLVLTPMDKKYKQLLKDFMREKYKWATWAQDNPQKVSANRKKLFRTLKMQEQAIYK